LGTPLVTSVFHADRWDYVFALKRRGQTEQTRRLSVFFDGDALVRFEGDELPSEADFVASIAPPKARGPLPNLQASEESLKRFAGQASTASPSSTAAAAGSAPSPVSATGSAPGSAAAFPPLEPPTR
jgi:outer membrane protein assembly factor BamE